MRRFAWGLALFLLSTRESPAEVGVSESQVLLGQPAAFSGPSAGLGVETWRGATAAFQAANDAGGVQGRRVVLLTADDAYDPERAVGAAKDLAEKAFALFAGVGTPTLVKVLPFVLEHFSKDGLFYFAPVTGAQPQREPPFDKVVFNLRASYREETETMIERLHAEGRDKIGVFAQDDAYGQSGRDGVRRALKKFGLEIAAEVAYPRGQRFEASNADKVEALKKAGVDAVVAVGAYQACAGFVRDAREGGLAVPIHNLSFVGADQMLTLLRLEEKRSGRALTTNLINTQVVPSYLDNAPMARSYRAAIDRYSPTVPAGVGDGSYRPTSPYSFSSFEGYVAAKAFLAILQRSGKDLTRRRFYEAAEAMGSFELGLGVKAELSASRHQVLDKVWLTTVTPGGWANLRD